MAVSLLRETVFGALDGALQNRYRKKRSDMRMNPLVVFHRLR